MKTQNNPTVEVILASGGEMLEQPLTNPDGSINPLCVAELLEAIDEAPAVPEYLANDPEWTEKLWTFPHDIVGAFAMWACRLSPYGVPDGLENVCRYLHAALKTEIKWDAAGMAEVSLSDVSRALYAILMDGSVKEFAAWNERKNKREGHQFASRSSGKPHPDDDFIDLDALLRNACITIRTERREFKAFNDDFERQHGKLDAREA